LAGGRILTEYIVGISCPHSCNVLPDHLAIIGWKPEGMADSNFAFLEYARTPYYMPSGLFPDTGDISHNAKEKKANGI
jgi:hypothetical protein